MKMYNLLFITSYILLLCLSFAIQDSIIQQSDSDKEIQLENCTIHQNITYIHSLAEYVLQTSYLQSMCYHRLPTMQERIQYYNPLRTGEVNAIEFQTFLNSHCNIKQNSNINSLLPLNWNDKFPNQIYAWTVDFHPSPSACNLPIYKDIGVILHPEIDHHPFCEYTGFCRNRLNSLFGLGPYMSGFALDPDHNRLKREFYEALSNDSEFQRIVSIVLPTSYNKFIILEILL